jgi:hypothetical protein
MCTNTNRSRFFTNVEVKKSGSLTGTTSHLGGQLKFPQQQHFFVKVEDVSFFHDQVP